MINFNKVTDDYINELKKTSAYTEYRAALETVKQNEELWRRIEEYRRRRTDYQNFSNNDDMYDKADRIRQEYADVFNNQDAKEFLDAEVAICRMVQDISIKIAEAIDFE